jgi:Zn-dependent peptidase ImmA (M78 family)
MTKQVPWLSEVRIEREAAALLADFALARGATIEAPIPIEDIVEKHLKLRIDFDDLGGIFGIPRFGGRSILSDCKPDILGAIYFDERRIFIDEFLDPQEHPSREGFFRFTLAHEGGGHWRLHRHLFAKDPTQSSFVNEQVPPAVVCRSSQAGESIEWQANFYASCLLMPRKLVRAAWDEIFPDRKPRIIQPRIAIDHPFVEVPREIDDLDRSKADDYTLDCIARPLSKQFLVSPIAMRIRLEKLGLLYRQVPQRSGIFMGASSPLF